MGAFGQAVADFVAAMGTLLVVALAWLVSVVVARHSGRVAERRDRDAARARVRAAWEAAMAETVVIVPAQREGSSL